MKYFMCPILLLLLAACSAPDPADSVDTGAATTSDPAASPTPSGAPVGLEDVPAVIARIGDKEIPRETYFEEVRTKQLQLDAELEVLRQTTRRDLPPQSLSKALLQQTLQNFVSKMLLQDLARASGVAITDAQIEERMAEGRENLIEDQKYEEYLAYYGITEDDLREQIRDQLLTEAYLKEHLEPCEIAEEDIVAKYDELFASNQMDGPEEVDMHHILLMVPPGSAEDVWEMRKEQINGLRERILGGTDFAAVANELSEDPSAKRNSGAYTNLVRDMMVPAVDSYLFSGEVGEISEPLRASYGWHIVRIDERREEGTRSFEDVRDQLRESLETNCQSRHAKELIDRLWAEHDVELLYRVAQDVHAAPGATGQAQ